MIKVSSALDQFQTTIEAAFTDAGFVDGTSLSAAKIKTEKKPLFWFMNVTSKDASDKPLYLTYDIVDMDPNEYGDGEALIRRARAIVYIYSKKRRISAEIKAVDDACISKFKNFELNNINYDAGIQRYQYSFRVAANISEIIENG